MLNYYQQHLQWSLAVLLYLKICVFLYLYLYICIFPPVHIFSLSRADHHLCIIFVFLYFPFYSTCLHIPSISGNPWQTTTFPNNSAVPNWLLNTNIWWWWLWVGSIDWPIFCLCLFQFCLCLLQFCLCLSLWVWEDLGPIDCSISAPIPCWEASEGSFRGKEGEFMEHLCLHFNFPCWEASDGSFRGKQGEIHGTFMLSLSLSMLRSQRGVIPREGGKIHGTFSLEICFKAIRSSNFLWWNNLGSWNQIFTPSCHCCCFLSQNLGDFN